MAKLELKYVDYYIRLYLRINPTDACDLMDFYL